MPRAALALFAAALAAGCGDGEQPATTPAPTPPPMEDPVKPPVTETPPTADTPPAGDASTCPTPAALAIEHIEARLAARDPDFTPGTSGTTESSFEEVDEHPDLTGDGTPDFVLRETSGRNVDHYFFVKGDDGCPRLVGVISIAPLFGFYCKQTRTNGLCDLGVTRLMIHGETEHATWVFDGTRYEQSGPVKLSPRPPKFR